MVKFNYVVTTSNFHTKIINTAAFKEAVCLYCLCEWSHLSSLCYENKPLVINRASLCYILSTDHLRRYTYECIANGSPLPTHVLMFHFVCSTLLFYRIWNSSHQSILMLYDKKSVTKVCTLLYAAVHGLPFWYMFHNTSSHIS